MPEQAKNLLLGADAKHWAGAACFTDFYKYTIAIIQGRSAGT